VSPRARVVLIVAAIAFAAAGATVAGALLQGGDIGGEVHGRTETSAGERAEPPALELAVIDRDDAEARELRRAERLYETKRQDEALAAFETLRERDPDSVEAAVGTVIASWPDRTVERLEALAARHPTSGVVRLNLGLALFAAGDLDGARTQWREAERRDPDTPAALRAEDLLNPGSPPGRPRFLLDPKPTPAAAWLRRGSTFERIGHRLSARGAYDRAVAADPDSLEAKVAAAVARFDKDRPAEAFSRLGPLTRTHPKAAVVRYHLGLLLLWLPNVEEAERQLRLARASSPGSLYGRQAARILARLAEIE
jgi:tetratricopeptide (TPR) repeat protein